MSKHKAIPKKTRIALYDRYNHKCAYCGCDMEYKDMQVDHIKSVYANADIKQIMSEDELYAEDNLLPTCRQCNFYKSSMNIELFRQRLTGTLMQNLQKTFQYRLALKYGLIEEHIKPVKFYYETIKNNHKDGVENA